MRFQSQWLQRIWRPTAGSPVRGIGFGDQACLLAPPGTQHQTCITYAEEDVKRKQLKKAGEEYFASVLEKAAKVSTLSSFITMMQRLLTSSDPDSLSRGRAVLQAQTAIAKSRTRPRPLVVWTLGTMPPMLCSPAALLHPEAARKQHLMCRPIRLSAQGPRVFAPSLCSFDCSRPIMQGKDPFAKYSSLSGDVPLRTGRAKQPTLPVSQSRPRREPQRVDDAGRLSVLPCTLGGTLARPADALKPCYPCQRHSCPASSVDCALLAAFSGT